MGAADGCAGGERAERGGALPAGGAGPEAVFPLAAEAAGGGEGILIETLTDHERDRLAADLPEADEPRLENYIVRSLIDYDDINYDECRDLLYRLATQVIEHLRSYLKDETAVRNVLLQRQRDLAGLVHAQMARHARERVTGYEARVSPGFNTLKYITMTTPAGEPVRNFRAPVEERAMIRGMVFEGFQRCLYSSTHFESDPERRFAVILEDDPDTTLKWLRPYKDQMPIYYGDEAYIPDFLVETRTEKLVCEIKRADQLADSTVQAKARAAEAWCRHATVHERTHAGKPWRCVLIPAEAVKPNRSLVSLVTEFGVAAQAG